MKSAQLQGDHNMTTHMWIVRVQFWVLKHPFVLHKKASVETFGADGEINFCHECKRHYQHWVLGLLWIA